MTQILAGPCLGGECGAHTAALRGGDVGGAGDDGVAGDDAAESYAEDGGRRRRERIGSRREGGQMYFLHSNRSFK